MAFAIVNNLLSAGLCLPEEVAVYDKFPPALEKYAHLGVRICRDFSSFVPLAEYVFICIKPQDYSALQELRGHFETGTFVSIAAGISTQQVCSLLGQTVPVVRVMPNTPLTLGEGAAAFCANEVVSQEALSFVKRVFESGGVAMQLPEEQMNAVISVNGSSPAYVYLFAKSAVEYAAQTGIDPDIALQLFCQVLIGSAEMMLRSGQTLQELIEAVSSKGGTTLAALQVLYDGGFETLVKQAMAACTERAEELAQQQKTGAVGGTR
ncbi:MAG: pyrroline-5-carboxylate reductase [Clostridia bacterium]|nr:pyrroline-5-carboxylate reductase [Clostridia bacterium]